MDQHTAAPGRGSPYCPRAFFVEHGDAYVRFALRENEYPTREVLRGTGRTLPREARREAPAAPARGTPGVAP